MSIDELVPTMLDFFNSSSGAMQSLAQESKVRTGFILDLGENIETEFDVNKFNSDTSVELEYLQHSLDRSNLSHDRKIMYKFYSNTISLLKTHILNMVVNNTHEELAYHIHATKTITKRLIFQLKLETN